MSPKTSTAKKNGSASKARNVIEESDEDDVPSKKSSSAKSKPKARKSVIEDDNYEEKPDEDDVRDKKGKGKTKEVKKADDAPKTSQKDGPTKFKYVKF